MYEEVRDCWCFNHECKNRTSESGDKSLCNKVKCTLRDSGIDDLIESSRASKHEKHSCVFTEFGVEQQNDMW